MKRVLRFTAQPRYALGSLFSRCITWKSKESERQIAMRFRIGGLSWKDKHDAEYRSENDSQSVTRSGEVVIKQTAWQWLGHRCSGWEIQGVPYIQSNCRGFEVLRHKQTGRVRFVFFWRAM